MTHVRDRGGETVRSTLGAVEAALRRRDARLVFLVTSTGYAVVYALATGALALGRGEGGGFSVAVVATPLERMIQSTGFLSFEPIARIGAPGLTYLFSPFDAAITVALAALVGANLAVSYLGLVQPRRCDLRSSTGVVAAIPALFSGAACCAPALLIALGVQATGVLITAFQLLVPVAFALLAASLLLAGRQIDADRLA